MEKPRVLILDDDVDVARELERYLADEFDVRSVETIDAAIDVVGADNAGEIEVFVTDMQLPGNRKAGIRAGEELAKGQRAPRIIVLTAFPEMSDVSASMQIGAFAYIEKGRTDTFEKLRERCAAASRQWREQYGEFSKPRVLLLDDDSDVRREIARHLGTEFDVTCCATIDEALDMLTYHSRARIDVVVSDMQLPGDRRGGVHLARELRGRSDAPTVVFFSAYPGIGYANDLLELGAYAFVEKGRSDTFETLMSVCRKAISERQSQSVPASDARVKLFISYSHDDTRYKNELDKHLAPLRKYCDVAVWSDQKIEAGMDWRNEIKCAMESTQIAVMLVSASFLGSEFCTDVEFAGFVRKRAQGGVALLGVLVSDCLWESVPVLRDIQMIPHDSNHRLKAIVSTRNRAAAWKSVVKEIGTVVERYRR